MQREVERASLEEQLALIRAHPDLGTRARIGVDSTREQAGAGLDRLTREEYDRLLRLNQGYRDKFGFPFILAVKGRSRKDIFDALERRLLAAYEDEVREALLQIGRIARFRIEAIVNTRTYYGKGDVIVYRLDRSGTGPANRSPVFGASVKILIRGEAFWATYTSGDNTGLIATDSMKNFVQRETANFPGADLESYCRFLADKFLSTYPQAEAAEISAEEIPYRQSGQTFMPSGPERATAHIEMNRTGLDVVRSGIRGFRLLRLHGSAFAGFVRDQYTTLPEVQDRPLHMWLDLDWTYIEEPAAFSEGTATKRVREIVLAVFDSFESGSIQQIIYQIGSKVLADVPAIDEVRLEANNRTWDMIVEPAIYTEPRPPYGILGLTLRR